MDDILHVAITHLLEQLEQGDTLIEDLLLVQVDWGAYRPSFSDEPVTFQFQGRTWPCVFTDSVLVLRRTLCSAGPEGRAILVVPANGGFELPLDLQARARQLPGCRLGLRQRLYALTERGWPPEVDYAEWRSSIERHFDALVRSAGKSTIRWDITRDDLETALVESAFGFRVEGQTAPSLLAQLLLAQRKAPPTPTDLERALLQGHLRQHQVAGAEILLWVAEQVGRAEELVRTGIMLAAEQAAQRLPNWGSLNRLRALLVNEVGLAESAAVGAVISLSVEALKLLHHATREKLVREAENALEGVLLPNSYNLWFPAALATAIESTAQRLAARDGEAASRIAALRAHLFASQFDAQLQSLDLMAELVEAWARWEHQDAEFYTVADWARWYIEHGARLDLTALKLTHQQQQGISLAEALGELLSKYWQWRDRYNLAFAQTFVVHYEAALHDRQAGVFGVHRILEWVVKPRLQAGERVLLVVMDGMGASACWELLQQWAAHAPAIYAHQPQAALALLPSVTAVSRKGLFLNALPTDRLDDEQTYADKASAKEAAALERACPGRAVRLFTKTDVGSGHEVLALLKFGGAELVAVVLNAIDDDIKNTTTTVRLPRLEDMGSLKSMVQSALDAHWTVVLTADHGHTWHRDKLRRRGDVAPGGGERFAPVTTEKGQPPDTIVTQDPNIVRVQMGQQVALLTAVGAYYGRQPRRGYHGGASLEEIVVPCLLLTHEAPVSIPQAASAAAPVTETTAPGDVDMRGIILNLADGRILSLELPFALSAAEARLLQTLARLGQASEAELKRALSTRRVAGPLAALRERLAQVGLDYIESTGAGAEGAIYRFRSELLERRSA